MLPRWVVVVPVKDARRGKSRLSGVLEPGARAALVRAMALDTLDAVLACDAVARLLVVTGDAEVGAAATRLPRTAVLPEPPAHEGDGPWSALDRAVSAGADRARAEAPTAPVAALLGDLPALDPSDLGRALTAAARHPLAVLPDADGTGTVLLTAGPGQPLRPRFGSGSAAAHADLGHVVLDLPVGAALRHDVDVPADLADLERRGVTGRTGALLRRLAPLPLPPG